LSAGSGLPRWLFEPEVWSLGYVGVRASSKFFVSKDVVREGL